MFIDDQGWISVAPVERVRGEGGRAPVAESSSPSETQPPNNTTKTNLPAATLQVFEKPFPRVAFVIGLLILTGAAVWAGSEISK
jgi:hypothetical protein